jgi:hypothetical protein
VRDTGNTKILSLAGVDTMAKSNAPMDLLAGKTPVAMYDALHAGRFLSPDGLASPAKVVELLHTTMKSSHRRQLEWVAAALAESEYLNEDGMALLGPGK